MSTRERIEALAQEAADAGDEEQVFLCEDALLGDEDAWARCEAVIRYAEAQS